MNSSQYKIQNTKSIALTGGAAAAEALRQINPDVMPVYPITPQTPIIETYAKMVADGEADTEIIDVESEHSAMSAAIGSQAAGARTVTASSSQGIMLMAEMLPIAAGMRLPILMFVSARAISAPINIHGDHQDVMFVRDSGWIQIFSENVQEVYDNSFVALKLAEKLRLPAMVIMDGFTTSHSVENLEILEKKAAKEFVGKYVPEESLLDFEAPRTLGPVALPNSYFEFKRQQMDAMDGAFEELREIFGNFEKISGRRYDFLETYKLEDAEHAIVVAGATAGTAKAAIDELREKGKKVGLLKIKLFRPFPHEMIAKALRSVKKIAVLDRTISFGTNQPLYAEISNALCSKPFAAKSQEKKPFAMPEVQSYIFGLGGREILKEDIKKIFNDTGENSGIKYIGLK